MSNYRKAHMDVIGKGEARTMSLTSDAAMAISRVVKWYQSSQMVVSMVIIQVIATGLYLLSRIILSKGTFIFALVTYRHIIAALCMAPFAIVVERRSWNKITGLAWLWMFINSLIGIIAAMGLYYYGLRDTNATYASNFLNLIPAVTFATSIALGIDKLRLRTGAGRIKMIGALLCVMGALVISLYKGPGFSIDHLNLSPQVGLVTNEVHWLRGSLFLLGSCLSYSVWFIIQVKLYKICPLRYTGTTVTCLMAAAQASVVGVCLDRSRAAWALGWDLQLVTIIYSGALATAATFCLISFAVAAKGPTYPPMFNPLSLIFTALVEALFLGGEVTLGCLLGMSLIILGLYSFLWGQKNEASSLASSFNAIVKLDQGMRTLVDSGPIIETANPSEDNITVVERV